MTKVMTILEFGLAFMAIRLPNKVSSIIFGPSFSLLISNHVSR